MDQSLLVFVLSVLVFVIGAIFINYTVKKEEAKQKAEKQQQVVTATSEVAHKAA